MKILKGLPLLAAGLLVVSCGGGDGSSPPDRTSNSAPQFTSSSALSVEENVTGSIYAASASDADGDSLTFTINGGADAAAFAITPAGRLSFVASPNFEAPSDADGDNRYQLSLAVSDGRAIGTIDLSIDVTNLADAATLVRIADGIGEVIDMSATDTEDLLVIASPAGNIFDFDPATSTLTNTGNVFSAHTEFEETRLVAIAPGKQYTSARSIAAIWTWRQASWAWPDPRTYAGFAAFRQNLVEEWSQLSASLSQEIDPSQLPLVKGTALRGENDFIYYFTGDGGEPESALDYQVLGNIIKIGPARNPCPGVSCGPEIYRVARGLHDPVGAVRIGETMFFVDRGETRYDEINQFQTNISSLDFGWPYREGRTEVRAGGAGPFVDPTLEYNRDSAAHEGFVSFDYYEGDLPGITGKFLLSTADGRFFSVDPADAEFGDLSSNEQVKELRGEFEPDVGTLDDIKKVVVMTGKIYVLDGDGELFVAVLETL